MFLLSFFGGLFTPVADLPVVLRHVAAFLPSYHDAVPRVGGGGRTGPRAWATPASSSATPPLLGLAVTWRHRVEESRAFA